MTKPRQELVHQSAQPMQAQPYQEAQSFSFEQMQRMAVSIAKSGIFGVKDADQALALMLIAHAQGQHPALVARDYDIIQGRPAKKSEAILRDFQASGGRVEWLQRDDQAAIANFSHPLSAKPLKITWDLDRAKKAGLMDKNGGMYSKYLRQMLSARCISEGCRAIAPQATGGFYTPEEVAQFDEAPAPAESITAAIDQTVDALPQDHIEALINSMDVGTLQALESAFSAAWRSTKDPVLRQRFKSVYDGQRAQIADSAVAPMGGDVGEGT
jgi:hypothetical protein